MRAGRLAAHGASPVGARNGGNSHGHKNGLDYNTARRFCQAPFLAGGCATRKTLSRHGVRLRKGPGPGRPV